MILAIDPGNEKSAWVLYNEGNIHACGIDDNMQMRTKLCLIGGNGCYCVDHMTIEMIASYGMAVGKTVFDTCLWIGRFIELWAVDHGHTTYTQVYRKDVKMHLCHSMRAKDANIRQAIIDRYPATGGGKLPQIGTKNNPGPLYGVSKDIWAAIGVAITYEETIMATSMKTKGT